MEHTLISYYVGIAIVILSHVAMLVLTGGKSLHAIANLVAACLIAYYFLTKENMFPFAKPVENPVATPPQK